MTYVVTDSRAVFNLVSKLNHVSFGFALLHSVIC